MINNVLPKIKIDDIVVELVYLLQTNEHSKS